MTGSLSEVATSQSTCLCSCVTGNLGRVTGNLGTITNRTGNRVLLHYFFGRDSGGTKPATR